jgi:heat-inducible transcriptional repressor
VLVILVFDHGEVQNRIIYTDRPYSASELGQATNFINQHYVGGDLMSFRKKVVTAMQEDRAKMDELMKMAIYLANQSVESENERDYVLAGQSHLLHLPDLANLDRLRTLFDAFATKQSILHLLDKSLNTEGIQIFIGKESGIQMLDECSIVTAPYSVKGEVLGVLGVIGSQRMPYDRIISIVDVTSRLLGMALQE